MVKAPEQIISFNRDALEATMKMAKLSMENAEKLVRLQLETLREMLEGNLKNAQDVADIKDPQQFATQRAKVLEESVEQMVTYSRKVYDLAAATQAELGKLMQTRFETFNRDIGQMVNNAATSAPAGSEPAMAAIKQTLAATHAMVDTLTRTAKQFAEVAAANFKSATTRNKGRAKKRT